MAQSTEVVSEMPIKMDAPPIKVGSDYGFTIEVKDDNKQVYDTTGWEMEIAARKNGHNGPELFRLTSNPSDGITHTPAAGRFVILIAAAITIELAVARVYFDCKITDNNGKVTFPFEGIWEILEASTR